MALYRDTYFTQAFAIHQCCMFSPNVVCTHLKCKHGVGTAKMLCTFF